MSFGAALPFLAAQNVLVPGFRATPAIASRYLGTVPDVLRQTGKALPKLLSPLKQINPFR